MSAGAVQEGGLRVKLHAQLLRIQCVYIVVSALLVLVSRALSHPSKHMLLKIPQTRRYLNVFAMLSDPLFGVTLCCFQGAF